MMEIWTREVCPSCKGEKMIYDSRWAEFNKKYNLVIPITDEMVYEFFGVASERDLPPEEYPCPDCEGTGWIKAWIKLEELLPKV
jgi:hypothetical protein